MWSGSRSDVVARWLKRCSKSVDQRCYCNASGASSLRTVSESRTALLRQWHFPRIPLSNQLRSPATEHR